MKKELKEAIVYLLGKVRKADDSDEILRLSQAVSHLICITKSGHDFLNEIEVP